MIIVKLFGGLGNQMFQYAAGRALALKKETELAMDINGFRAHVQHDYELNEFQLEAKFVSEDTAYNAVNLPSNLIPRLVSTIRNRFLPLEQRRSIINQKTFHFTKLESIATKNCYLNGLFQSENFFHPFEEIIRSDFRLKNPLSLKKQTILNRIQSVKSVSITIRRGDYLDYSGLNLYGEDMQYFNSAIKYISDKIADSEFFVFSDDIEWVKTNLTIPFTVNFVSKKYEMVNGYIRNPEKHEDLYLMSQCKHNIITNSTYAWWGAWLNPNPNKIVIAPKIWMDPKTIWNDGNTVNFEDIVPESWVKL